MFSGSQSHQGNSQSPVARMAERRETKVLKPIDKANFRKASESPGRNASECPWYLVKLKISEAETETASDEGSMFH